MARYISSTELQQRLETNEDLVLIDVHNHEDYLREHIPGAVNIPLIDLEQRALDVVNKDSYIVVYGKSHNHDKSNNAVEVLENLGFTRISDFDGGIDAWKRAGFRTEGNEIRPLGEPPVAL